MLQLSSTVQRIAQAAIESGELDSDTTAQDARADELLSDDELASVAAGSTVRDGSRPFLRDNWVLRATNGKLPYWLAGYENWVYLLVLAAIAGGLWWHFKKK